jgi:hypothetical protein
MVSGQTSRLEVVSASLGQGGRRCPLWVKSRHCGISNQCPLYPLKRTSSNAIWVSAQCQKLTSLPNKKVSQQVKTRLSTCPRGYITWAMIFCSVRTDNVTNQTQK